ncbi:MAG: macro domain-containing protein [Candidatus Kapaibacterium sp.]
MKIILTAIDEPLAYAWESFCGDLNFVTIHRGSILDLECDAVVSPANSYGFMDGGIDAIYTDHFGRDLEMRVRERIRDHHHGELLVGTADIVATGNTQIPYMIIAPTMRVPMALENSVHPYLAARAVFLLGKHGVISDGPAKGTKVADAIRTIAIPGLGTGVGRVGANTCAHQVRQAINDLLLEQYRMPESFADASIRHQLLYREVPTRLQ